MALSVLMLAAHGARYEALACGRDGFVTYRGGASAFHSPSSCRCKAEPSQRTSVRTLGWMTLPHDYKA